MINIEKQIEYWRNSSEEDINTAELLIKNKRILHGLFFCHLCIEKILKAHVTKTTKAIPPKSHDLPYLLKLSGLSLKEDKVQFLQLLMNYQLEGRYPEYYPNVPSSDTTNGYLSKTNDILLCLRKML